jgi:hypothetical protein
MALAIVSVAKFSAFVFSGVMDDITSQQSPRFVVPEQGFFYISSSSALTFDSATS